MKQNVKKLFGAVGVFLGAAGASLTWNAQSLKKIAATTTDPTELARLLIGSGDLLFNAAYVGLAAATCAAIATRLD